MQNSTMEIDLSKFVDKQVRVTYRSGMKVEGRIIERIKELDYVSKPYLFRDNRDNVYPTPYTRYGRYFINGGPDAEYDITHIEELKPMDKYKEEDHLNLRTVSITRTVTYTPEEYFEFCKHVKQKPTTEGYKEYYCDEDRLYDCFVDSGCYTQEIKEVEE